MKKIKTISYGVDDTFIICDINNKIYLHIIIIIIFKTKKGTKKKNENFNLICVRGKKIIIYFIISQ
jgi:hypothetical protein